jgi:hypothetical protein
MVEILDEMTSYVPDVQTQSGESVPYPLAFAGDMLTAARARTAQDVRVTCTSSKKALRGVFPFASDWHAKVNYMEVSTIILYIHTLYAMEIVREGGGSYRAV